MFKALGVEFDFSRSHLGEIFIHRTSERKAEVLESIEKSLADNSLTPKEAEQLRGRLQWYNAYLFGRAPCKALHEISRRATARAKVNALDAELVKGLKDMASHLRSAQPIRISAESRPTKFVFSDGSLENGTAEVGAILFDARGVPLSFQ